MTIVIGLLPVVLMAAAFNEPENRFPLLSNAEVWKKLPTTEAGGGQALPSWARALASSLPQTTAVMLELDRTYRTSDSLDPRLSAAIRLVVARTIRSEYGRACAELDLRRAGLKQAIAAGKITDLSGDSYRLQIDTTHSGWSGMLLILGKGPFDPKLLGGGAASRGADWPQKFKAAAAQGGWKTEMVWYRTAMPGEN